MAQEVNKLAGQQSPEAIGYRRVHEHAVGRVSKRCKFPQRKASLPSSTLFHLQTLRTCRSDKISGSNGNASESKYVTLISRDGFEFIVLREAALVSPTIKGMLRGPFQEAQTGRCTFPEIRYAIPWSRCFQFIYLQRFWRINIIPFLSILFLLR